MHERLRFEDLKKEYILTTQTHLEELQKASYDEMVYDAKNILRIVELRSRMVEASVKLTDYLQQQRLNHLQNREESF